MAERVNGGIINDQMLAGSLLHFKIVGSLAYAVSDGTVTVGSPSSGGNPDVTRYPLVGINRPVPESLAEHIVKKLSEKCTIVQIGLVGAPGSETEMHISVNATAFGWIDTNGDVDTAAMVSAIGDPATIEVYTTSGGAAEDNTQQPVKVSVSTTVTVTEVPFVLA
jgi:hypothetical protein